MTANQLISHTEQMEAARRDFHRFWDDHLVPSLSGMAAGAGHKITPREAGIAYHSAWIAFREGIRVREAAWASAPAPDPDSDHRAPEQGPGAS